MNDSEYAAAKLVLFHASKFRSSLNKRIKLQLDKLKDKSSEDFSLKYDSGYTQALMNIRDEILEIEDDIKMTITTLEFVGKLERFKKIPAVQGKPEDDK